jgi:hypothetical protein
LAIQVVEQARLDSEILTITVNSSKTDILVDELKKWTDYRVWVSAGSSVGDNPPTPPVVVRTDEDGAFRHVQFTTHFHDSSRAEFPSCRPLSEPTLIYTFKISLK